jgi:hypothetical protein
MVLASMTLLVRTRLVEVAAKGAAVRPDQP